MAYPASPLPVEVDIAPGADLTADPGTWKFTPIINQVRIKSGIAIDPMGRPAGASRTDPSKCSLVLDDRLADFADRNPFGQWYGLLGPNTPLRTRIRRVQDAFARTVANGWGSADSGQSWTPSGGIASDYSVSSGTGRLSLGAVNAARSMVSACSLRDIESTVTIVVPATPTGAAIVAGWMSRRVDANNYYAAELVVNTTSAVDLRIRKVVAGVSTTLATTTNVLTHTPAKKMRIRFALTYGALDARVWDADLAEPLGWQVSTTDTALDVRGAVGPQATLTTGNTNGLPVVVTVDDAQVRVDRYTGFVPKWLTRWDKTGKDATAPIQASGLLRRLSQGNAPARSPLYASMSGIAAGDYQPYAYWAMEDGATATSFASGLPGGTPMTFTGTVSPAADASLPGSLPLPTFAAGAFARASIPAYTNTGKWVLQASVNMTATTTVFDLITDGTGQRVTVTFNFGTQIIDIVVYDASGAAVYTAPGFPFVAADVSGRWVSVTVSERELATHQLDCSYQILGGSVVNSFGDLIPGRYGRVRSIGLLTTGAATAVLGHVGFYTDPRFTVNIDDYYNARAMDGWSREPAGKRVQRVCKENNIRYSPSGLEADTTPMGPQPNGTVLEILRQCEDTDHGILIEVNFGFTYQPRRARYMRAAELVLAAGDLAEAPEPANDDERLRNYITAKRVGGSQVVATPPDDDRRSVKRVGQLEATADLNLPNDDPLIQHAYWLLNQGTADETRWDALALDLAARPAHIDAWLSLRPGARVTAAITQAQVRYDQPDVLVDGYSEYLGNKDFDVIMATLPARPYDVAVYGPHANARRYQARSSVLAAGVDNVATALTVATTDLREPPWITSAAFPTRFAPTADMQIKLGGLVYSCTAITSLMSDVFTRTVANGWGTATSGQAWTTSGGSAADYAVGSGVGSHSMGSVNVSRNSLATLAAGDCTVQALATVPVMPTGAAVDVAVLARRNSSSGDWYGARTSIATTGVVAVQWAKSVAGVVTAIGDSTVIPGLHTAGDSYWIRGQVSGNTMAMTAWRSTATKPTWLMTATDTDVPTGSAVGARTILNTGNTNATPVITWDNFEVVNPQTFTLTRLAIDKPHLVGAPVQIHQPPRYGL